MLVQDLQVGNKRKGNDLLSGPGPILDVFISINSCNSHSARRGGNNHPNFTDGETELERESDEFVVTWAVSGGVGNVGRCEASPQRGVLHKIQHVQGEEPDGGRPVII